MTDSNQRESRHVHVSGVPDDWDDAKLIQHLGGRVQRVERTAPSEAIMSFFEVRTAKKIIAENTDANLRISFCETGSSSSNVVNQPSEANNDNDRQRKPRSGSSSPRPSGDRLIRPHSAQDQHRRKPSSTNSSSPKHRSIGSPISHHSSSSSSGRRTSANDDSPTMSRKLTRPDLEGEPTTLYTIRFDKLPSTLLVPWEVQKKDILDLVGKYGTKVEVAVDAVENERQDRQATLFLSLLPGYSIDTVVKSINAMHIETEPVIAKLITGSEPSTSTLPPPPQVPVLISKSVDPGSHGGFVPTDLSHIEPNNKAASRTLHVKNLDKKVTVASLKEKFGKVAEIIDVEIKNPESPSPYAFIQFPDVHSVIETIKHYYSSDEYRRSKYKYKLNWGKTKTASKLWIGQLSQGIAKEQIASKIRSVVVGDEVLEVIFDPARLEAVIVFRHKDAATKALEMLKNRSIIFTNCQESLHIDYCSDKLHSRFRERINLEPLPQPPIPPPQIHGYNPQQPPPPQRIIIDTSQPPPPIPPPPHPPRELIAPVGIEAISGESTPSGDMQYRKHHRSLTPDYDRRRERERHRDRRERERRSRSRSRGRRHDRRSRSRDGDRRRERERKRSKSMSSVSSASSDSSSSEDSRRRHGHRSSKDSRRHREYVDKPMAISSGSDSLEPPPPPPHIDNSGKTDFSHHPSTSSHQQSTVRRHSNEVVPPPPQPPVHSVPGSKPNIPPMSKETAAQMQKPRIEKVSTPKRVYFTKPFSRAFKHPELDPRPRPLPIKNEDRIVIRWGDVVPRRLSTENPPQIRKSNLPPLILSDDMRPRLSSSSSLNTPTPSSSSMNRVQERLERLLKKDDPNKKSNPSALHIDTSIVTPTSSIPTPTSSNRTEMLQHTLSATTLKSPSLLSPGSRRQSTSNIPTPSPISRQTSLNLGQPQLSQSVASPISSASGLSTPKMSSGASPRSSLVTPTYQMSILKGAKMPTSAQLQSQSASVIKEKPTFPGIPKPNASAPGSKTNTPTTPYSGHKFAPTPTTPSKAALPSTQQKPKLSTTGLPPLMSKDQKPKTPITTPDANKKVIEKKMSMQSIPGTPPVPGSSTPKMSKSGEKEKEKDLAIANSWRERQQEKIKKDSAMIAAFNAGKKSSKSEKALHQVQSGHIEKKKKKKSEQEEKTDITDEYMRALTSAGRKDSTFDKDRERRRQEKKEAKRKARELEARKEAKLQRKEKKKKKRRESDDSDSCDPIESSVRKKIGKEYKEYFQEGGEGAIGLSMYDRVKRRTSGAKDDDAKRKQEALELIKRKKEREQKKQKITCEDSSGDESSSKLTGHQVSLENDSEAASSTTSQSSQKKKKIGAVEKARFEEKKRKREKERREQEKLQEKLKKRQSESRDHEKKEGESKEERKERKEREKMEKLKAFVPELSSTEDSLDKTPSKFSKKSESESEEEGHGASTHSRRGSLQKREQKNVLKRIKRRRMSSNSEDEEPESPQNKIDMTDVFGGDSGSENESKKSVLKDIQKKKDRKAFKEEERRREEKRLKKEKKKRREEDSSAVEKDTDKELELKRRRKEEKKRLQEKEEKRKLKEQKRLEAEKEAKKLKKSKKLEEISRKRKHHTDESDTAAEATPKVKKPSKKSRSPTFGSKLDDVIDSVRLGENIPMDVSSNSESPKSTAASSLKIPASPMGSPVSSKKSIKSPNLGQSSKNTVATSPSMSSSTSDSSSAPTKISEPLPPVREETPIPVPLGGFQRRGSTVSRLMVSSGDSSADEEALLQAMNSDSQETAQAAEVVQRQMEQEAAVDNYHYGPGRIMEKKRESDASLDPEFVRNRFNSMDRRSSQDSSSAHSIMQSPHMRTLPQPVQSPSLMVGNLPKSMTAEQLAEIARQAALPRSPLASPVGSSNDAFRRQLQSMKLPSSQKTPNLLQSPQAVFNFVQQADSVDKKPILNISAQGTGSSLSGGYRKPSDPKPSDLFVSQLQLSPEDPSKGAIDDIVNSIAHDREDLKKQKIQKESTGSKNNDPSTAGLKEEENSKAVIRRPCSTMSLAAVSDNGIDPSFIEPQKEKHNTSSDFTSGTHSTESTESALVPKIQSDFENISEGTVVTVYDDAMKVVPENEAHARVNKQYPVLWEGLLLYREEAYPIQFHSVVVFKNDFRPFLGVLTELSDIHQMKSMKIRQRCKMDEKSRFHNIVAKTVFSQNVPFHLMLGVLGEKDGEVTPEHVSGMRKLFYSRDGAQPAGCICTALAQGDRQVALHLMLKSSGTERILRYYAPNLRNYLTDRNITYVLGILCFDFINSKEGYEKMKNLIPVTLPKKYMKQKWLLEDTEVGPAVSSTVEVTK